MPRGKHQNQVFRVTEDAPSSRNAKAHPIKELDYNYPFFLFFFSFGAVGRESGREVLLVPAAFLGEGWRKPGEQGMITGRS